MNGEAVTYAELDLKVCGLEYGVRPCEAVLEGDFKPAWASYMLNSLNGWTAASQATLTKAASGMEVLSTGGDPIISRSLSVPGGANPIIEIEATRLVAAASWDGKIFYATGGHGYAGGFYKQFAGANPFPVGVRTKLYIDMATLTAGGTDWTSNTITGLRLDFDAAAGGKILLHSVRIGHYATADEATGTQKCFNTRKTCQDPVHYDAQDRPTTYGTQTDVATYIGPGTTLNATNRSIGAVATGNEKKRVIVVEAYLQRVSGGAASVTSATIGGKTALIRDQQTNGTVTVAILEAEQDPGGTTANVVLNFNVGPDAVHLITKRLVDMTFAETKKASALRDPSVSFPAVGDSDVILGVLATHLLGPTTWTGLEENTDAGVPSASIAYSDAFLLHNGSEEAVAITTDQTSANRAIPTVISSDLATMEEGVGALTLSGQPGDIAVYAVETNEGSVVNSVNTNLIDFVQTGITSGVAGNQRVTLFWQRFTGTSLLANFTTGSDHGYIRGTVIRGANPYSSPIAAAIGKLTGQTVATTAAVIPAITTPMNNCLVLDFLGRGDDSTSAMISSWANGTLSSQAAIFDGGTTIGNGGGIAANAGNMGTAGNTDTTTANLSRSLVVSGIKIAIVPTDFSDDRAALVAARYVWDIPRRNTIATVLFGMDTGFQSKDIDSINCLTDYSHTPTVVSLGENLGTRESLTLRFADIPHPDIGPGFDPYWDERDYDPYNQGTLFGKLAARQPYMRGITIRWYEGFSDESLDEMTVRTLILDSFNGPDSDFNVSIVAKDPLKLADSDKAVAPFPNDGYLLNDITDVQTSAVLSPSGIGNAQYPTSGIGTIAGNELVSFTRSGDSLTIARAQSGTPASAHSQQDRFQVALIYSAQDVADILYDLLVTYAGVNPEWINLEDWQAETDAYLRRVYTAIIGEPTPVRKLIVELIVSCGLAMWWDSENAKIRMIVLREVPADATIIDTSVRMDAPQLRDQPDKRVSQMVVHFAIKDPLKGLNDPNNFQQSVRVISPESELNYEVSALKNVYSRWIAAFARTTAERVGDINVGRFENAPKRVSFSVFRNAQVIPVTGGAYRLRARNLQAPDGLLETIPIQVTSVKIERDRFAVEAEEMRFVTSEQDLTNRVITIDGTSYNLNLRDVHDDIYPALRPGDTVTFIFNETAKVGSNSETLPAVHVGSWPVGFVPHVEVRGKIQGCGGTGGKGANEGGNAGSGGKNGTKGGTALYTRTAITLTSPGNIWGGGGGGAGGSCADFDDHRGGGGGGGAGLRGGTGGIGPGNGEDGKPGTETAGGAYGRSYTSSTFWTGPSLRSNVHGGAGGAPGQAGDNDAGGYDVGGGSPGAAGNSIDGISYVTNIGATGTRLGPQVN